MNRFEKAPNGKELGDSSTAEFLEKRGPTKGNMLAINSDRTQRRARLQQDLERVRKLAVQDKAFQFTSIWHLAYDVDRLYEAYLATKTQSAPGIDGQTKEKYGENIDENLADLSSRLARGAYHAKPVKRVYIPKTDGKLRPIGVPALEDKIVQRATAEVLQAIYEVDFRDFSFGFRPGRSQHQALDTLAVGLTERRLNWVLDADIRGFFDNIDHERLMKFIKHRIADKRVWRHIQKWLQAGVLENGEVIRAEYGTPQGGSISPLLANIYLHYAFDNWAHSWRIKEAAGDMIVVRYADDIVTSFEHRDDAKRFLTSMQERMGRSHLELNMDKTVLLEFGQRAHQDQQTRGGRALATFDFLGFTHYCSNTRGGKFVVKRKTSGKKMRAKLKALRKELRVRLHDPVRQVGEWLGSVLKGHYQYYAVPFNFAMLTKFRFQILCSWKRTLSRRSQKAYCDWEQANYLATRYLPRPRIIHPYPDKRVGVTT